MSFAVSLLPYVCVSPPPFFFLLAWGAVDTTNCAENLLVGTYWDPPRMPLPKIDHGLKSQVVNANVRALGS